MVNKELTHINKKPIKNKYGNRKVLVDGIEFDSLSEYKRYALLKYRQQLGEIARLEVHPRYPLMCGDVPIKIRHYRRIKKGARAGETIEIARQVYIELDFEYEELSTNRDVIEDVKGFDTDLSRLKRAIFEASTGRRVEVVR